MEKIASQVEKLFSEKEQWDAFLELVPQKDTIKNEWLAKLKPSLIKIFNLDDVVDGWEFDSTENDYRWYLKDFGRNSIYLFFDNFSFGLCANGDIMNIASLKIKLRDKAFLPIIAAFERLDYCLEDDEEWYLFYETGNFSFGSSLDKNIDEYSLSWYANYRNDDFALQLHQKVDRFRKNKEIIKLLVELNSFTIKNTKKNKV
jgi:hypothetical protein